MVTKCIYVKSKNKLHTTVKEQVLCSEKVWSKLSRNTVQTLKDRVTEWVIILIKIISLIMIRV